MSDDHSSSGMLQHAPSSTSHTKTAPLQRDPTAKFVLTPSTGSWHALTADNQPSLTRTTWSWLSTPSGQSRSTPCYGWRGGWGTGGHVGQHAVCDPVQSAPASNSQARLASTASQPPAPPLTAPAPPPRAATPPATGGLCRRWGRAGSTGASPGTPGCRPRSSPATGTPQTAGQSCCRRRAWSTP